MKFLWLFPRFLHSLLEFREVETNFRNNCRKFIEDIFSRFWEIALVRMYVLFVCFMLTRPICCSNLQEAHRALCCLINLNLSRGMFFSAVPHAQMYMPFAQRNFVADFRQTKCDFIRKVAILRSSPFFGNLGATCDDHLNLTGKRVWDCVSWTF